MFANNASKEVWLVKRRERREWFQRRKESSKRRERTFVYVAEIVCVLTGKNSHRDVEHPPEAYDVGDESISGAGLFLEN